MPRSVGRDTSPGGAVSFVARHQRTVVAAFVLLVVVATQGAAADVGMGPTASGATHVGP